VKYLRWVLLTLSLLIIGLVVLPAPSIWIGPTPVGKQDGGLQALSCATDSTCLTFDFRGRTFVLESKSWHRGPKLFLSKDQELPTDVSCPESSFCVVTGNEGDVAVVGGSNVTSTLLVSGVRIERISCPTSSFCMALADKGPGPWEFDGSTWKIRHHLAQGGTAVSCVSQSFCVVANGRGLAMFNGRSWHLRHLLRFGDGEISQLSCATPRFCLGVTSHGAWATFNGRTWRLHEKFESGNQQLGFTPKMLACPAPEKCIAASTNNVMYRYENGGWSELGYLFRQSILSRYFEKILPTPAVSVSCPTVSTCIAVDGNGNAYQGKPF